MSIERTSGNPIIPNLDGSGVGSGEELETFRPLQHHDGEGGGVTDLDDFPVPMGEGFKEAGYREEPWLLRDGDPDIVLIDPDELEKHPRLHDTVEVLRSGGKEVWGKYAANKGIMLTVISAAAAAAGAVGIGVWIKRRK